MLTRRDWLSLTLGTGAALALDRVHLMAQLPLLMRAIPSSGERVPIVGLGSSATFSQVARAADVTALREVFQAPVCQGRAGVGPAPRHGATGGGFGRNGAGLGRARQDLAGAQ